MKSPTRSMSGSSASATPGNDTTLTAGIPYRHDDIAPDFEAENVLPTISRKAVDYLEEHSKSPDGPPFFLYLPLTAPHTPLVPAAPFAGKSGLGVYGDFVMQVDASVGTVVDALGRRGLDQNTLLIVTSDNGCAPSAGFAEKVLPTSE